MVRPDINRALSCGARLHIFVVILSFRPVVFVFKRQNPCAPSTSLWKGVPLIIFFFVTNHCRTIDPRRLVAVVRSRATGATANRVYQTCVVSYTFLLFSYTYSWLLCLLVNSGFWLLLCSWFLSSGSEKRHYFSGRIPIRYDMNVI